MAVRVSPFEIGTQRARRVEPGAAGKSNTECAGR